MEAILIMITVVEFRESRACIGWPAKLLSILCECYLGSVLQPRLIQSIGIEGVMVPFVCKCSHI